MWMRRLYLGLQTPSARKITFSIFTVTVKYINLNDIYSDCKIHYT